MEIVSVRDIEGLAMVGKVRKYWVEKVGKRTNRICVEIDDGSTLCTRDLSEEEVELVKRCLELYSRVRLVR